MWLIRASVRRPVLTSVISIILIFLGIYAYLNLGVTLLPSMDASMIRVQINYRGAGPEELEALLIKPMEDAVSTVEGITNIRAVMRPGLAALIITLAPGIDPDRAATDISTNIRAEAHRFPRDASEPVITKADTESDPFMTIVAISDYPANQIRDMIEEDVVPRLTQIPGMANAEVIGGRRREIHIEVNPLDLKSHNLSVTSLGNLLANTNENTPVGVIAAGDKTVSLRMIGEPDSTSSIENITIPLGDRQFIRVGDVGRVVDTFAVETNRARFNGKESIMIELVARPNSSVIQVAQDVRRTLAEIQERLPDEIQLQVVYDTSLTMKESVDNIIRDMILGALLTALILYLCLQRFGATVAVLVSLPTSIISTFMMMSLFGFTLNTMSVMGLAISVGVLVNNSILVLENIYRYREMGLSPQEASEKGAAEIGVAVIASIATNLGVFIPLAFMGGMIGALFYQFALTVAFATIISLYASFSLTPMIATYFGGSQGHISPFAKATTGWWQRIFDNLAGMDHSLVKKTIKHPYITLIIFLSLALAGFLGIRQVGFEMMSRQDEGQISISVNLSVTASIDATDEVVKAIEEFVMRNPYVRAVSATAGGVGSNSQANMGRINVYLIDPKDRPSAFDIIGEWRATFAAIPDTNIAVNVPSSRVLGASGGNPVRIFASGPETDVLVRICEDLMAAMRDTPGLVDINMDFTLGSEELWFYPRFNRLSELGVTLDNVTSEVNGYLTGYPAGFFRDMGYEYDIRVILEPEWRSDAVKFASVPTWTPNGFVPLDDLMEIETALGPTIITRENRQRAMTVNANLSGENTVGEAMTLLRPKMDEIDLPMGYSFIFGGEMRNIQDNFGGMFTTMLLAVIITFLIVAGLLESYYFAVITILCVPISVIGIMPMIWLSGTTFSVFTILGIIMLIGIVVNNAIVILDYAEMKRKSGMHYTEAILEASKTRFRPIFMADLTTLVAVIPMALTTGAGAADRAPMAIVMIGGILGGGFLALWMIPAVYNLSWGFRERLKEMIEKKKHG